MAGWPGGVAGRVFGPATYTMTYLNGTRTYSEIFADVHVPASYLQAAEASIDSALAALAASLSETVIGSIAALLAGIAVHLAAAMVLNPDGSLDLRVARHYAGGNVGIDPTAWPVPGVDANAWGMAADALVAACRAIGRDTVKEGLSVTAAPVIETLPSKGNYGPPPVK